MLVKIRYRMLVTRYRREEAKEDVTHDSLATRAQLHCVRVSLLFFTRYFRRAAEPIVCVCKDDQNEMWVCHRSRTRKKSLNNQRSRTNMQRRKRDRRRRSYCLNCFLSNRSISTRLIHDKRQIQFRETRDQSSIPLSVSPRSLTFEKRGSQLSNVFGNFRILFSTCASSLQQHRNCSSPRSVR